MADVARAQGGSRRSQRVIVGGFFAVLVIVGLLAYGDFGVSWDEPLYYQYGELTRDFYASGDRGFETLSNLRFYGPAVPLLHAVVADIVDVSSTSAIQLAHLVNYLVFVVGVAAFYRLLVLQTGSWRWALLGAGMLVLSPRIFSHAFVNPKDGPFLALFIINVYVLVEYLESRRRWLLVVLGAVSAVLVDVRVIGLAMVVFVLAALAAEALAGDRSERISAFIRPMWIYLIVLVPVTVLLWPFLWPDPLGRFGEALELMSNFSVGPQSNRFMGDDVPVVSLPWHYVPVWVGITTPTPYLALALVGLVTRLRGSPLSRYTERKLERHYYLYAAWLLGPVLLIIVQRSPLYDEWRHVNFVYPALIIFAVAGTQAIWAWLGRVRPSVVLRAGFAVALGASMLLVGVAMVRLHPYQALYFNWLVGGTGGARDQYELDYWGLSYAEGLEFLLDSYPDRDLRVLTCTDPGVLNAVLFDERDRLKFVAGAAEADFAICAPRGEALALEGEPQPLADHPTIFSVRRDGAEILYVKDMRA